MIPILYKINDFLMDQKNELDKFDMLRRKAKTESRKAEIREQQEYLYSQGLQALHRYHREVPPSVKGFYLGNRKKPSTQKISKELEKIVVNYRQINRKVAYITVAILFTILFVIAILS